MAIMVNRKRYLLWRQLRNELVVQSTDHQLWHQLEESIYDYLNYQMRNQLWCSSILQLQRQLEK